MPDHCKSAPILGWKAPRSRPLLSTRHGSQCWCTYPRMQGHDQPRINNGPTLAGYGTVPVQNAIGVVNRNTTQTAPEGR